MCASLAEEAEAIGWYEQRISVEPDEMSRAIMIDSLGEEYKHFCMELEFLFREKPLWRETARGILFTDGDIVANGEAAEAAAGGGADGDVAANSTVRSLGIGTLKGQGL
jgi:hypothetical protein